MCVVSDHNNDDNGFLREGASGGRVGSQGPGLGLYYLDKDKSRRYKMS